MGEDRLRGQNLVVMRGKGGGEGELTMSLDRRKRQTLSVSGSAYSVESGAGE